MSFKSLFSLRRRSASQHAPSDHDAGGIVILMMALVFVPIVAAHAAVIWQDEFGPQQLAAIVSVLFRAF